MQPGQNEENEPTVTFYRLYPAAIPPMRADKAALGTMPTMAYRHCEPLRTASAFGWYIFPPEDLYLKWNGADVLCLQDGEWSPLTQVHLPGFPEYWDEHAPADLKGASPAFAGRLPMRGFVQIWSGMLCATRADWSVLVRPLANIPSSNLFRCFEGVVESDRFRPFPLFINIQLLATDVVIEIPKVTPLFQVQPLMRATYDDGAHTFAQREGLVLQPDGQGGLTEEDWAGYRGTTRIENYDEMESGQYAVATRKRTKHEG